MTVSTLTTLVIVAAALAVFIYFWSRALRTGRVLAKVSGVIKRETQPFYYWTTMAVYALWAVIVLLYVVAGALSLLRHHHQ